MYHISKELRNLFKNDYAITHELTVILSHGVEFKDYMLKKNKPYLHSPKITEDFIREYKIINLPQMQFVQEDYNIYLNSLFEFEKPNKEKLEQSALRYFKDDIPNRDFVIQNTYDIALRDIQRKEKYFTDSFISTINLRMGYLKDSIELFNRSQLC